jgi:hypothetical protein
MRSWRDITPAGAVAINLLDASGAGIQPPLNENGEPCPWPWEPQQLKGAPMGQYHCPYCGAMCLAGVPHPDYRDTSSEEG